MNYSVVVSCGDCPWYGFCRFEAWPIDIGFQYDLSPLKMSYPFPIFSGNKGCFCEIAGKFKKLFFINYFIVSIFYIWLRNFGSQFRVFFEKYIDFKLKCVIDHTWYLFSRTTVLPAFGTKLMPDSDTRVFLLVYKRGACKKAFGASSGNGGVLAWQRWPISSVFQWQICPVRQCLWYEALKSQIFSFVIVTLFCFYFASTYKWISDISAVFVHILCLLLYRLPLGLGALVGRDW